MHKRRKKDMRAHINIGTIVFLLMVIYIVCNLLNTLSKNKLAVYEVSNSEISDTIKGTGIIIREEKVISSAEEGYLNSYLSDGARVKNKGIVYTIDKTGKIQDEINKILEESTGTSKQEQNKISEDLRTFTDGYKDADFYMVAETQNEIDHDLLSYTGSLLTKNKKELEKKYGKDCYIEVKSEESGLVSYSSDGLEELKKEQLTKTVFNRKVHMEDLRTNAKAPAGTKVYRLTTSQKWELVLPLTDDDYVRMKSLMEKEVHTIQMTVEKDGFCLNVPFDCYEHRGQKYLALYFSNYVQRYLNQRYLTVEILLLQGSGLKIPASSLVKKNAFRIPKDYLTEGSNSDKKDHVNVVYTDKKGKEKIKQITVKVLDEKDGMVSIFSNSLKVGNRIKNVNDANTYSLNKVVSVFGVYTINSGYAIFSQVEIEERNEDYCIVNSENSEIELYDRIVLNSNAIHENEIIY